MTTSKKHRYMYSHGCHLTVSNAQLMISEKNKAISNHRLISKHKTDNKHKSEKTNKNWCTRPGTYSNILIGGITG